MRPMPRCPAKPTAPRGKALRSRGPRSTVAVAVTGGIGAGKSTFCRICRRFPGVAHIDADRIVRGLLACSPPVWREIRAIFGRSI